MEIICTPEHCTGCMACSNVCPKTAIKFTPDCEGFMRPIIDPALCIDCHLCEKVCPVNHSTKMNSPIETFSGWSSDEEIRMTSSSGGIFSELATEILNNRGSVYGAALDDDLNVKHVRIDSISKLDSLRGSKYVQSQIGKTYIEIKKDLNTGLSVLFSGTPCQVGGLLNYLGKDYPNLITIDIACHGVPSPKVFNDWKEWIKKKYSFKNIDSIGFRGKKKSWLYYNIYVKGIKSNGKPFTYIGKYHQDPWIRGFLSDNFLRPGCYVCGYTTIGRCSDITLADCWGYRSAPSESGDYEKRGVSLILCNTDKGREMLERCKNRMTLRKRDCKEVTKSNPPFNHPSKRPICRDEFWRDYENMTFEEIRKKYLKKKKYTIPDIIRMNVPPSKARNIIMGLYYKFKK